MILHLYFAKRFATWLGIVFLGLFALIALVDLIDQTRRFADRGVSAGGILELVFLKGILIPCFNHLPRATRLEDPWVQGWGWQL